MLASYAFLLLLPTSGVPELDALARARDVEGIAKFYASEMKLPFNPLSVIRTGGVYGTGRYGWNAFPLETPGGGKSYVVFSTPLTSQDVGERVFEISGEKLVDYVAEQDDWGWSVERHKLDVSFDVANKRAILKDTVRLRRDSGSSSLAMLRFGPNYRVKSISDDASKELPFTQGGGVVLVKLPEGQSVATLNLAYEGLVNRPTYAGSISEKEAMLTNDYWYPMIARKPSAHEVTVRTPRAWTTVAQGELVSVKDVGQEKLTQYRMDMPVVYFSLSSGPYRMIRAETRGKRYQVWSQEMTEDEMRLQTELYPPILEFYERFGKLPFSGYGAMVSSRYGSGALEAYSFATYGTGWLPDEDAHEPAHTWWGGMVNNTYFKSLWNESFAVFSEGLYARNVPIGSVQDRALAFVQTPDSNPACNAAPLVASGVDIGPAASALGYGKGAWVLQMLEVELGTDLMIKCLREWVSTHPKGVKAEWEDFEAVVNRTAGRDLKGFFDQWLRRTGVARFEVSDLDWAAGAVRGKLKFTGQPYRINCEVMLEFPDGTREFKKFDTMERATSDGYEFTIPSSRKPALVSIDPWRRVLRDIRNDERPLEIMNLRFRARRYQDPKQPDYLKEMDSRERLTSLPQDLNGVFLVGHPNTTPEMRPLCAKAGFAVNGQKLTYKGRTIDLTQGAALAVVDLGEGKWCLIGLGQTRLAPNSGRARTGVFDDLGRFLAGTTDPKTSGWLTFRL